MGELWHRFTQCLVKENLARGIVHVVVTADDGGDPHGGVVDHHNEVVGGGAVAALDDQVVQFLVVERDRPLDQVVEGGDSFLRCAETYHRRAAGSCSGKIAAS